GEHKHAPRARCPSEAQVCNAQITDDGHKRCRRQSQAFCHVFRAQMGKGEIPRDSATVDSPSTRSRSECRRSECPTTAGRCHAWRRLDRPVEIDSFRPNTKADLWICWATAFFGFTPVLRVSGPHI